MSGDYSALLRAGYYIQGELAAYRFICWAGLLNHIPKDALFAL